MENILNHFGADLMLMMTYWYFSSAFSRFVLDSKTNYVISNLNNLYLVSILIRGVFVLIDLALIGLVIYNYGFITALIFIGLYLIMLTAGDLHARSPQLSSPGEFLRYNILGAFSVGVSFYLLVTYFF